MMTFIIYATSNVDHFLGVLSLFGAFTLSIAYLCNVITSQIVRIKQVSSKRCAILESQKL